MQPQHATHLAHQMTLQPQHLQSPQHQLQQSSPGVQAHQAAFTSLQLDQQQGQMSGQSNSSSLHLQTRHHHQLQDFYHQLHLHPSNKNLVHKQPHHHHHHQHQLSSGNQYQSGARLKQLAQFAARQRPQAAELGITTTRAQPALAGAGEPSMSEPGWLEADSPASGGLHQVSPGAAGTRVAKKVADSVYSALAYGCTSGGPGGLVVASSAHRSRVSSLSTGSSSSGQAPQAAQSPVPFITRSTSFSTPGSRRATSSDLYYAPVASPNELSTAAVAAAPQHFGAQPPPGGGQQVSSVQRQLCSAAGSPQSSESAASGRGINTSPGNQQQQICHSPTNSYTCSSSTGPNMSPSDALNLGINLEQYISKRNERERSRVRNVNDAFDNLKNSLPLDAERLTKRMSKVEILRTAISYIKNLEDVLGYKQQQQQQQQHQLHLDHSIDSRQQLVDSRSSQSNVVVTTTTTTITANNNNQLTSPSSPASPRSLQTVEYLDNGTNHSTGRAQGEPGSLAAQCMKREMASKSSSPFDSTATMTGCFRQTEPEPTRDGGGEQQFNCGSNYENSMRNFHYDQFQGF